MPSARAANSRQKQEDQDAWLGTGLSEFQVFLFIYIGAKWGLMKDITMGTRKKTIVWGLKGQQY